MKQGTKQLQRIVHHLAQPVHDNFHCPLYDHAASLYSKSLCEQDILNLLNMMILFFLNSVYHVMPFLRRRCANFISSFIFQQWYYFVQACSTIASKLRPVCGTVAAIQAPIWLACSGKNFVYSLQIPARTDVQSEFSTLLC